MYILNIIITYVVYYQLQIITAARMLRLEAGGWGEGAGGGGGGRGGFRQTGRTKL